MLLHQKQSFNFHAAKSCPIYNSAWFYMYFWITVVGIRIINVNYISTHWPYYFIKWHDMNPYNLQERSPYSLFPWKILVLPWNTNFVIPTTFQFQSYDCPSAEITLKDMVRTSQYHATQNTTKDNKVCAQCDMMTSSNGNIFRVTGPLCGEFTGTGEFPTQRPVTRSFDVYFDLGLNKRLSKQPWGWWFETPSWSLWRQCNDNTWYSQVSL